ncbi:Scr1 family TA system antitoxin-like transcriptional regulator [Streptomyces flavidovirens]|uniref:Scr1 family TA system antitoxin-like transcriptional regulator n=1 Tax=Streptomyces flavidovirens TaxID=67298 RepID=UPI0031342502
MEHHSTRLQSATTSHIPGLLQITDHAREIFRQVVPEFSRTEVEHRVNHRLQRQALLDRADDLVRARARAPARHRLAGSVARSGAC